MMSLDHKHHVWKNDEAQCSANQTLKNETDKKFNEAKGSKT